MKTQIIILAALAMAFLAGCRSAGFEPNAAPDLITPGASAETKVRTWDAQDGNPRERTVENPEAFR